MCQISINSGHLTILHLAGGKHFINIIFDIIRAINNWLYANELLYLDKLFQNHSFRISFPMTLITRKFSESVTHKFYFYLLFRVTNSEIIF